MYDKNFKKLNLNIYDIYINVKNIVSKECVCVCVCVCVCMCVYVRVYTNALCNE